MENSTFETVTKDIVNSNVCLLSSALVKDSNGFVFWWKAA